MTTNYHTPITTGAPANASTINNPLGQLDSELTNANTNVTNLTTGLATTNTNVTNLTSGLATTNTNVTNLTSGLATTNSNLATVTSDVEGLTTDLASTNADVASLTSDLATTNTNVTSLTSGLATTNSNLATVTSDVAGLTTDLATTNANVASLTSGLATTNTNLATVTSDVASLTTGLATSNTNVTNLTTAFNNLKTGVDGFTQLSLSNTSTLTIATGAITVTRSRHLVDTESSASYDDLNTINGGVAGDVLVLQSVNSSRVVVIKNEAGNIFLNGMDVYLDNPRKAITLMHDGTQWVLIGNPPEQIDRRQAGVSFISGSAFPVGLGALDISGTASLAQETDALYTKYTTDVVTGSMAGIFYLNSMHLRMSYNPSMTVWLKTGSSIAGIRWYIGFHTGNIYLSNDNLASTGVQGVVLRYSTVAGDTGFRPVTSNGTTQTLGNSIATVSANTLYKITVSIVNGVAYYVINGSTPVTASVTMPSASANLGWSTHLQTQQAVAKSLLYKKILVEMN